MKTFYYKTLTGILMTVFLCSQMIAQTTSTYIYLNPIYAFPAGSSKLFETSATRNGVTYTKGVYGSFGSGFSIQGGIGKMLNNNFGVELAAEWVDGKKVHSELNSDVDSVNGTQWQKVNSFMLKPMIILRNSGDLMTFYSKLGLAVSVFSQGNADGTIVLVTGGQSNQITASEVTKISATVGFVAAFGISFRISQSMAITGELSGQLISLPESSGYYSVFNINGADQLPTMSVSTKSWTYEKSISDAPGNPNKPGTKLYEPQNFSYIGISIGLRYYL